jgi:hypothetical protein
MVLKALNSVVFYKELRILPLSLGLGCSLIRLIDTGISTSVSVALPGSGLQDVIYRFRRCCLNVCHQRLPFESVVELLSLDMLAALLTEGFHELMILSRQIVMLNM